MEMWPILGILTLPKNSSPIPFSAGQNESFIEIMSVAEKMKCFTYVFSPLDIDWTKKATWGYIYNSKLQPGEWERLEFPLPSVIYNRIPNRTLENREDVRSAVKALRKIYGPKFFNPCFLDKWTVHRILSGNNNTKSFLPNTIMLNNLDTFMEMLNRHRSVYLKPCANSLGNEIIKVKKKDNNLHYFYQSLNQPCREGTVGNCLDLLNKTIMDSKNNSYLIQQAIGLAKYNGNPFDLRFLIQKNKYGKWQKTGMAARIAGENSITTHVFYGGSRVPAETAIKHAAEKYGFELNKVKKQLKLMQTLIPQTIENAYKATFGELEMDIGVDRNGKVWFFEANSKPFKFDEKVIRAKSLVRLIDYVLYLNKTAPINSPGLANLWR